MGVQARIVLFAPDESSARDGASAAFARIAALEQVMSDYRPDSELSVLAATPPFVTRRVSADLYDVLAISEEVSLATGGAFDVTIGPVVKLWREARKSGIPPDQPTLAGAWNAVGFTDLLIDRRTHTLALGLPGMSLDLGGIGKGYAAQQASDLLRTLGYPRHLVALAGDIVVGDAPLDPLTGEPARAWTIDIQTGADPHAGAPEHARKLLLTNAAISTSGDSTQSFELDGVRYSHIIDPRPARSLAHAPTLSDQASIGRRGVTIVASRGEHADALGTAFTIVGPEWLSREQGEHRIGSVLRRFNAHAAVIEWRDDDHTQAEGPPPPFHSRTIDPRATLIWSE